MFIQLKDLDQTINEKDASVFILYTKDTNPLYISRSFAGHSVTQFTSIDKEHAIIYFNRQSAIDARSTSFYFTGLSLEIERIPINSNVKEDAKQADSVKKLAKIEARRKREIDYASKSK